MAIVQISRITARKGLQEDLPSPLAGAELGWSVDQRRLYIGNGTTEEGAPALGNTEILTEYSDILAYTKQYTYEGAAAGYVVQTGSTPGSPVTQSLQNRLDSLCIITDFGAVGDGSTDCTEAINRALFQIYCRQVNPQIRRGIFFPAGVYKISDTLLIPPYAMLFGEGSQSTVISFQAPAWVNTVTYAQGVLVQNSSTYYRSLLPVPIGTDIGNATFWEATTLPTHIVQTADSLQQTGLNIATNGAIAPVNVELDSMGFATSEIQSGLLIEDATQVTLRSISVTGSQTTSNLTTSADATQAIEFASSPSLICSQVIIDGAVMSGFTWASNISESVKSVSYNSCQFDTLYQGVVLSSGGPSGVAVTQGFFDHIYAQGLVFDGVSLNTSTNNAFFDVGNHFNGVGYPATSIISINSANNVSVGDMFQRTAANSTTFPRIDLNYSASYAMTNAEKIEFGTYTREVGNTATLADNTSNQTVFTVGSSAVRAFQVNYTIVRGVYTRTGVLTVVAGTDGAGTNMVTNDTGFENSTTGVTWTITEAANVVTVKANTTSTGATALLNYSITHLA